MLRQAKRRSKLRDAPQARRLRRRSNRCRLALLLRLVGDDEDSTHLALHRLIIRNLRLRRLRRRLRRRYHMRRRSSRDPYCQRLRRREDKALPILRRQAFDAE